ncbi:MAG: glycoside hydrolase family 3 N-terminal domain-containing protein, partial [Acidimicrobiales bacterium]
MARWPLARQAAAVVALPSLDFDIDQLEGPLAAGAGGVLFLGRAPAPEDLASRIQKARSVHPTGSTPLVMADEEGGGVQRLSALVGSIPWPRQMATGDTPAQVQRLAFGLGARMRETGIDLDLAPVLDVDGKPGPSATNPDGSRSFSADPVVTATYGDAFIEGLRAGGVTPVAKHFPGLGGSSSNTDYGLAATLSLARLQSGAFLPFASAIAAGVPAIMVANASVPGLTAQPASVSSAVVTGLLRDKLHFDGLVLTDSLSAGAITQAGYTVPSAAVAAIAAGADMVLFGSTLTPANTVALTPAHVQGTFN